MYKYININKYKCLKVYKYINVNLCKYTVPRQKKVQKKKKKT